MLQEKHNTDFGALMKRGIKVVVIGVVLVLLVIGIVQISSVGNVVVGVRGHAYLLTWRVGLINSQKPKATPKGAPKHEGQPVALLGTNI